MCLKTAFNFVFQYMTVYVLLGLFYMICASAQIENTVGDI